jgi:hypothetical protein
MIDPTNLPETTVLTFLAAQPRFANLPDEQAALSALKLWRVCATVRENERVAADPHSKESMQKWIDRLGLPKLPEPATWPAGYRDFYKAIIKGKDEGENQQRYKRFLRQQLDAEQTQIEEEIKKLTDTGAVAADLEGLKAMRLPTDQALDEEVDKRFVTFKSSQFNLDSWKILATRFLLWWGQQKTEARARAGRERARKQRLKNVTQEQATSKLTKAAGEGCAKGKAREERSSP